VGWHLLHVAIMFGLLAVPLEFEFGQMNSRAARKYDGSKQVSVGMVAIAT
jgi:hypothetical protein